MLERVPVFQDRMGAVVAGSAAHATARMGARAAEVQGGGSWDRVGIREALPSLLLFGIAGVTILLAIGLGPVAIVVPLTTAYPVVAILVRRFWMDERLTLPQKFAVGLAMLGAVFAAL